MARGNLIAAGTAALVMALSAWGCGEGAGPPEIGHASSGPITEQRVEEFARTVNLRADDLPGATAQRTEYRLSEPTEQEELERCDLGSPSADVVAGAASPTFYYAGVGEAAFFVSTVEAAPTEDELADFMREMKTAKGFACFRRLVTNFIRREQPPGSPFQELKAWRIRQPLPSGHQGVAVRVHSPSLQGAAEHGSYVDVIRFIAGHAEIALTAVGVPTPVDQDVEAGLVAKLVERAERHAL